MGVKQFFKIKITNKASDFIGQTISQIGEKVNLKNFKGKRLCNDASLMIYQSILALESIKSLTDGDGNTTVHINTIFNKIIQQAQAGIVQIWIFDSPIPNEFKKREYVKRKERREKNSSEKVDYSLNKIHVEEIQSLLEYMGIMYIVSPTGIEAEQYGAYLTRGPIEDRFCQYMITGDSDVLFFGGNLLRISSEKTNTGKSKKTIYQTFDIDELLNETGLSYDEFLRMGVLMGTDFCDKMPGIGPATVIKKVNTQLSPAMENTIKYFKSDIADKIENAKIVENKYNREKLVEFLSSRKFNKDRVEKRLNDYEKTFEK